LNLAPFRLNLAPRETSCVLVLKLPPRDGVVAQVGKGGGSRCGGRCCARHMTRVTAVERDR